MTQIPVLTLLTDFGLEDTYVGVMKGVIAQINPQVRVIDLTHQIPPQNVALARFALMTACPYFPAGTVHLAVVDPGVGSQRRSIALAFGAPEQPTGFLVGPDNGLFSGVLSQSPVSRVVELTNSRYWLTSQPSTTFHGRDIFAPVAAHLARGVALADLGTPIAADSLVQLDLPQVEQIQLPTDATRWTGAIQAIDHFGNLITTIPASLITGNSWAVRVNQRMVVGRATYADCPTGEPLALIGSHGWVEIAVNRGNAQKQLGVSLGESIQVIVAAPNPTPYGQPE